MNLYYKTFSKPWWLGMISFLTGYLTAFATIKYGYAWPLIPIGVGAAIYTAIASSEKGLEHTS